MSLRIHPEAEAEIEAAREYIEKQRPGWGARLLQELEEVLRSVELNPSRWTLLETESDGNTFRRVRLRRFRYNLIFEELDASVIILAFAHTRRKPHYWKTRSVDG